MILFGGLMGVEVTVTQTSEGYHLGFHLAGFNGVWASIVHTLHRLL